MGLSWSPMAQHLVHIVETDDTDKTNWYSDAIPSPTWYSCQEIGISTPLQLFHRGIIIFVDGFEQLWAFDKYHNFVVKSKSTQKTHGDFISRSRRIKNWPEQVVIMFVLIKH